VRVPSFERFRRISAAGAFFVCGMVVGAAVWSGLEGEHLNQVLKENFELNQQIADYKEDLSRMQSDSERGSVIQSIVVFIGEPKGKNAIDIVSETELKRRVKEDLAVFRGRRIYNIGKDALFARKLFENKVYAGIGGNDYEVRITTMLVAEGALQVWVEAEKAHLRP